MPDNTSFAVVIDVIGNAKIAITITTATSINDARIILSFIILHLVKLGIHAR
jgi:hypothetical protein